MFEDVGFQYPGSEAWAVRHVSFKLRPGERIAFVGENGAGKTTLTKLLARLYDPTEGRILLDGVDLREYDIKSVRRAIGVIFQDFVKYDLRFDENVGVGEIDKVRGRIWTRRVRSEQDGRAKRQTARKRGDARRDCFCFGEVACVEPAAAIRKRVQADARAGALMKESSCRAASGRRSRSRGLTCAMHRCLILDEPTASLDARAEYEVFIRFSQLVAGRMAVIISHRFSTVRMADRIIVLQNGMVIEDGSHQELVAHGGLYAELFALQAEGYR